MESSFKQQAQAKLITETSTQDEDKDHIEGIAAAFHENWRANDIPEAERGDKRIRSKRGGPAQDINVPWNKLHPTAQEENREAAAAALEAYRLHGDDTEKAAEHIHNAWMERNRSSRNSDNESQFVPYAKLSEEEKNKDRRQVHLVRKHFEGTKKLQEESITVGGHPYVMVDSTTLIM